MPEKFTKTLQAPEVTAHTGLMGGTGRLNCLLVVSVGLCGQQHCLSRTVFYSARNIGNETEQRAFSIQWFFSCPCQSMLTAFSLSTL